MSTLYLEDYLRFVANKIQEARVKGDLVEVKRILEVCVATCVEKIKEVQDD